MAGEARLADLCESIVDCPHSTPVWTDSGVVVLRNQNIRNGRLDLSEPSYTDEAHFVDRTRRALPTEGDLVITREAPMGEVCMIPPDLRCCLGQRMVLLRPSRQRAEPRYLLYALQSKAVQHEIGVSEGTGSTVSNLRIPLLEALPIPTRSLPEQRAIAHILGTLDDKIELNRRMNETLEAMARALFKSWFVDFDPVRAKAEGRARRDGARSGQPRKPLNVASDLPRPGAEAGAGAEGDPGLPQPLADLFPDSFEDSELGEIPEGWGVGTLADFATLNPESWSKETHPTLINYVDLSNTKWGRIESVTAYAQGDAPSRAQRVLRPRDTIVGTVRPGNGSYALVSVHGLTGSTGFAVLRPTNTACAEFVYLAATAAENIEALSHLADGGAYPAVRPEVVAATKIMKPSNGVLLAFSSVAAPLLGKLAGNERQSRTLAALRDELLPKLISGELRVTDADRFVAGISAKTTGAQA